MSFSRPGGLVDRPLRGIAYMLLGIAAFSATDGLSKWMVMAAPIPQIVVLRNAFTLALILPVVARSGGLRVLATRRPWAHATRAALSVGSLVTFFEALRYLPLATCIAIGFVSPLFMTASSVVLLGERVDRHRWLAIAIGFAGVLIVAWPDAGGFATLAAGLMVVSSLCFALAMIAVRWLARTESEAAMLVYQNSGMLLAGLIGLPFVWTPPVMTDLAVIAAMAVTLVVGQVFTIRAFRSASVGVVAPFEYTELVWASIIGYVVWKETPAPHVWAGASIIVLSGLYMIWREAWAGRRAAMSAASPAPSAPASLGPGP